VTANVSLVDERMISLMCAQFRISGCGFVWLSCALWELLSFIQMCPSVFSRSRGHQIQKFFYISTTNMIHLQ